MELRMAPARLSAMHANRRLLVVVPAILTLLSCRRGPRGLAEVAGHPVTTEEWTDTVVAQTGRPFAEASPELKSALFEAFLEEAVLLAASPDPRDRGLPPGQRSARCRELLTSLCPPLPPPAADEVDAALARRILLPRTGEQVRLRQLVLPDQSAAHKARERVRQGEDFAALSREISRAPNAAQGGAIGWVERGQLPPEFEAAVFTLAPEEVSRPVRSNAGWHVFQVTERRAPGADTGARDEVRNELIVRANEAARTRCLRDLATKVGVRVDCRTASFPCRNPFEDSP